MMERMRKEKKMAQYLMIPELHQHGLTLIEKLITGEGDDVKCWICQKTLLSASPIYTCSSSEVCKFYLHPSCADIPKKIQTLFHPCPLLFHYDNDCNLNFKTRSCHACGDQIVHDMMYKCAQHCKYMHLSCALVLLYRNESEVVVIVEEEEGGDKEKELELIHHFTHQHPLIPVHLNEEKGKVRCNICDELCYDDSSVYGCVKHCNEFFLHISCMNSLPQKIDNHSIHACHRPLIFMMRSLATHCHSCNDDISERFVFHCEECFVCLDVKCALLPTVECEGANRIQNFAHLHPLQLVALDQSKKINVPNCNACGKSCWLGFGCSHGCNFFLHKKCALFLHKNSPQLPQKIHHPLHHSHPLILTKNSLSYFLPAKTCSLCCKSITSADLFQYKCRKYESCSFGLHTYCAMFIPSVKFRDEFHLLTLCKQSHFPLDCNICSSQVSNFFRCMVCALNIHLYCHPLVPLTIKHKSHLHALTLTKSPFDYELNSPEDAENSDDEFYCDVCEEKRKKTDQVYYCADCKFIAEIACVFSELKPHFFPCSGDQSLVMSSESISIDEENSTKDTAIARVNDELVTLNAHGKLLTQEWEPLKGKMKQLEAEMEKLKPELEGIEAKRTKTMQRLDNLDVESFLLNYQPIYKSKLLDQVGSSAT